MSDFSLGPLSLSPIGVVRSPFVERREAPRQPVLASERRATIELFPELSMQKALEDIDSWSHLWVVFWFHLNAGWRPMVRPPRGEKRRGVLATRSPHRPNPIGLSAVKLERREGLLLHVSGVDILDGTPVLDLKPYVPYTDLVPEASGGWPEASAGSVFLVTFESRADEQLEFLGAVGTELRQTLESSLMLGPKQPKYRRIRLHGDHGTVAVKSWRARFTWDADTVRVTEVYSGYRADALRDASNPELVLHQALEARFPRP